VRYLVQERGSGVVQLKEHRHLKHQRCAPLGAFEMQSLGVSVCNYETSPEFLLNGKK
jgi:hypothetical protein